MMLICPKCAKLSMIKVYLSNRELECPDCNQKFTMDTVDEMMRLVERWKPILDWISKIPKEPKEN